MAQENVERQRPQDDGADHDDTAAPAPGAAQAHQQMSDDLDSILDEIDGVLESNAEDFVKQFVQKGGQ